jgi:uncharacterized protein YecE (DUF72 family)
MGWLLVDFIFGTSGWDYKEWIGLFYKNGEKKFSFYTGFFRTSEINSTFYRMPTRAMVYGLYRSAPENFVFSAKLPKTCTHEKRLNPDLKVKNDLLEFLELMNPLRLNHKLGAILIQLPPSFVYERDHENLEAFLEMLPQDFEFAIEFRDHSWMRDETWKLMRDHNVAYTIVDEPLLPPTVEVTANFAYIRWHGRGERIWYDYHYSQGELEPWVSKIKDVSKNVEKIYGYFNNHFHGYAVENCIQILEMLNSASPEQIEIKDRIIQYNLEKRPKAYKAIKEFGVVEEEALGLEDFLINLAGDARYERARDIEDEEIEIVEASDELIQANIRDYVIEVNLKNRVISHNCDDWRKGLGMKTLCKHVCKLFISLPSETSEGILRDIVKNRSKWKFQLTS